MLEIYTVYHTLNIHKLVSQERFDDFNIYLFPLTIDKTWMKDAKLRCLRLRKTF